MPDNNIIDLAYITTFDPCREVKDNTQQSDSKLIDAEMKACLQDLKARNFKDIKYPNLARTKNLRRKILLHYIPNFLEKNPEDAEKIRNKEHERYQKLNDLEKHKFVETLWIEAHSNFQSDVAVLNRLYNEDPGNVRIQCALGAMKHLYHEDGHLNLAMHHANIFKGAYEVAQLASTSDLTINHIELSDAVEKDTTCIGQSISHTRSFRAIKRYRGEDKEDHAINMQHKLDISFDDRTGKITTHHVINSANWPDDIHAALSIYIPEKLTQSVIQAQPTQVKFEARRYPYSSIWQKISVVMMYLTGLELLTALLYLMVDTKTPTTPQLWFHHYLPVMAILLSALATILFVWYCQSRRDFHTLKEHSAWREPEHLKKIRKGPSNRINMSLKTLQKAFTQQIRSKRASQKDDTILADFVWHQIAIDFNRNDPSISYAYPILEALIERDLPDIMPTQESFLPTEKILMQGDQKSNNGVITNLQNHYNKTTIKHIQKIRYYILKLKNIISENSAPQAKNGHKAKARNILRAIFHLFNQGGILNVGYVTERLFIKPDKNISVAGTDFRRRDYCYENKRQDEKESKTFTITLKSKDSRNHHSKERSIVEVENEKYYKIGGQVTAKLHICIPKKTEENLMYAYELENKGCHRQFKTVIDDNNLRDRWLEAFCSSNEEGKGIKITEKTCCSRSRSTM